MTIKKQLLLELKDSDCIELIANYYYKNELCDLVILGNEEKIIEFIEKEMTEEGEIRGWKVTGWEIKGEEVLL